MDAYLATVSKREVREYADQPVSQSDLERILQAGRASGSSQNRQPWTFVLVTDPDRLKALGEVVYAPDNLKTCAAAIAVVTKTEAQRFDAGRAAQNMMLAAWDLGIGTCPNGVRKVERARELLEIGDDRHIATIISLGYPARKVLPNGKQPEGLLERINRKPLDEIVRHIG